MAAGALLLSAAPTVASLIQSSKQRREADRLKKLGPDKLSPYMREAIARSRVEANTTVTPELQSEKELLDQQVAQASENAERITDNASDAQIINSSLFRRRGEATKRLIARNQARRDQSGRQLDRLLTQGSFQEQRNKEIWDNDIQRLQGASAQNTYNALFNMASGAIAGMGDDELEKDFGDKAIDKLFSGKKRKGITGASGAIGAKPFNNSFAKGNNDFGVSRNNR